MHPPQAFGQGLAASHALLAGIPKGKTNPADF